MRKSFDGLSGQVKQEMKQYVAEWRFIHFHQQAAQPGEADLLG
jgi:hypothetical protein